MMNKKKTKNDMLEINNSIKDNNMTKTIWPKNVQSKDEKRKIYKLLMMC
jgi:hypothetical protein